MLQPIVDVLVVIDWMIAVEHFEFIAQLPPRPLSLLADVMRRRPRFSTHDSPLARTYILIFIFGGPSADGKCLSLVRNPRQQIGFLRKHGRINASLSRR